MNMKLQKVLIPLLAISLSVTACYRNEIASMQNQIDTFTEVHINPIVEQVKQIDAAVAVLKDKDTQMESDIKKLQAMKGELEGKISDLDTRISKAIEKADENRALIEALEATRDEMKNKLNSIDASIEDLEKRVGTLEEQIKELETFRAELAELNSRLGEEIQNTKEWTEANFVSLEEYKKTVGELGPMIEDLKELKATLGNVIDYIPTIERRFDKDEADIEALWKEAEQIRKDYAEAIKTAHDDVLDILDKKVEALQNWVISAVADTLDDYYTIAKTDQLLANLKATIEKDYKAADTELLNKIEGLRNDLNTAKSDIEAAYKKAIQDVADEFDKKYKDQGAKIEGIEKRLTSIETEIKDLGDIRTRLTAVEKLAGETKSALESITGRVEDLEGQAELIKQDIEKLKGIDKKVNERIDSLGKAHKDSTQNLRDEIGRLKQADAAINSTIDKLQKYIDGELTNGIKDWASQTFATLEREKEMDDSLVAVFGLLGMTPDGKGGWVSKFDSYYDKDAIDAKLDEMGGWVSSQLDNYYDIATIDGKLSEVVSGAAADVDSVKQNLRSEIAALKETVTSEHEAYIAAAIAKGGIIDLAISDSVNTLRTEVNEKLVGINNEITELKTRLTALENVVQSVVFIPDYDDGKIFIPSEYNETTKKYSNPKRDIKLRYKINTKNAGFDPENYSITGDLVDALAATKVVYAGTRVDFKDVSYVDSKGILECTFNSEVIPVWFFDESKSAAMSLTISDTKTEISSSFVGLRMEKVAGGGGGGGGGDDPVGNFRVDPAGISVGNQGGVTMATVIAAKDISWRVNSIPDWVDVQVVGYMISSLYVGTQFISVSIGKNTSDQPRDGVVTFKSAYTSETATLTIHQEKREPQRLDIAPTLPEEIHFDWEGYIDEFKSSKSYVYTVTPSDQMSDWTCTYTKNLTWLHVSESESLGAGKRTVTITVDRRTKSKAGYYTEVHEADVTFSSVSGETHTVHVVQDLRPDGELIFTPDSLNTRLNIYFKWDDNSNASYQFKVQPSDSLKDWTPNSNSNPTPTPNKFTLSGLRRGDKLDSGEANVTVKPQNRNMTFSPVTSQLEFATADGNTSYTLNIIQEARPSQTVDFDPSTNPVEFDWEGKIDSKTYYRVSVVTNDGINDWNNPTKTDGDWFTVECNNSQKNSGYFQISGIGKFEEDEQQRTYREGTVSVVSASGDDTEQLTIRQYRRPEQTLTLGTAPGPLEFRWDATTPKVEPITEESESFEISVVPSDGRSDWKYYLPGEKSADDYFILSKTTHDDKDWVVVKTKKNNDKSDFTPTSTLTIKSGTGVKYEFPLKQNARPEQTLSFSPASGSSINFDWKGETKILTVTTTSDDKLTDWTYNNISGITLQKTDKGNGVVELSIKVQKNVDGRTETLTITNANGNKVGEFTIIQDARPEQIFKNPSPASGTEFEFYKNGKLRESGESTVTVNLNPSDTVYDYGVSSDKNWCNVVNPKDGTLKISVDELGNSGSRNCTVTIKSATESQTVTYTITQKKTYVVSTIPTTKYGIESDTEYTYTISAYGEGCKVYYTKDVTYGTITVSGIGNAKNSATEISSDVSVKIKATKNNKNRLTGSVVFRIIDSNSNEVDNMTVSYSYDTSGIFTVTYHYYVQAQQ